MLRLPILCVIAYSALTQTVSTHAQMIQVQTPFNSVGGGYYENSNLNWSLRRHGFASQFGGGGAVPFGGFSPNQGVNSGIGFRAGGFSGSLGFGFAQGSDRFSSTVVPSLTLTDGMPGAFYSGVTRPFVVGIFPVVSSYTPVSPIGNEYVAIMQAQQMVESQRINAQQQAELMYRQRADKVDELLQKADEAEAAGDSKKAKNFTFAAKKYADGPRLQEVMSRL